MKTELAWLLSPRQLATARGLPGLACIFAFVVLLLHPSPPVLAQGSDALILTPEKLQGGRAVALDDIEWRYHTGDDAAWAAKDFDDGAWESITNGRLNARVLAGEGWNGSGWFRLRVAVDERLVARPLAIRIAHWGASEIYLDGKLLQKFGSIAADSETSFNPRLRPVPFVFESGGEHTFAVRQSYRATSDPSKGVGRWLARGRLLPGFNGYIQSADDAVVGYGWQERNTHRDSLFAGILLAFGLLHFLIFIFFRRERANLFYSLFVFSLAAGTIFNNAHSDGARTAFTSAMLFASFIAAHAVALTFLLAFLYVAFAGRFSKFFWLVLASLGALLVVAAVYLKDYVSLYATCAFFLLIVADAVRIMAHALVERREGAWIIAAGVLLFACAVLTVIVSELDVVDLSDAVSYFAGVGLMLAVPLAVSFFLARNFARTNHNLATQLEQVKTLSARQLEHERTEAELRLQHEKERAENERRAQELEGARQLQLSMLPKQVPQLPGLDIAAYLKPATEVGGDYYDFYVGDDGTLTVAVGDATGHGLRAGMMVTATKSLFNSHAHEPDVARILSQASGALKGMNLRSLFMAMTIIKIRGNRLCISSAGMPPALIYRAARRMVEEVAIKAMPLGSVRDFPYRQREFTLEAGDAVVLMSDGFAERFNGQGEMLDYERAKEVLAEVAEGSAEEVINHFVQVGEQWADGHPQDDDVTFVVLKVKDSDNVRAKL